MRVEYLFALFRNENEIRDKLNFQINCFKRGCSAFVFFLSQSFNLTTMQAR